MPKNESIPFSFRINKKDKDTFQKLYPYCLSRFVKLCISRALHDPKFFQDIFFSKEI